MNIIFFISSHSIAMPSNKCTLTMLLNVLLLDRSCYIVLQRLRKNYLSKKKKKMQISRFGNYLDTIDLINCVDNFYKGIYLIYILKIM
jgi:hypothetical protein